MCRSLLVATSGIPRFLMDRGFLLYLPENKRIMAHSYDYNSVQELLSWAKNMLENKTYPASPYQLSKCINILDCEYFIESSIATISKHWENPTFHPYIEHLWEFREKIEGEKA